MGKTKIFVSDSSYSDAEYDAMLEGYTPVKQFRGKSGEYVVRGELMEQLDMF